MSKKHDLPYMPWYWGDWFKCPEVRALSPAARCLWFEMLGLMWESTERGYLTLNGKPYPKEALARSLSFACDLLDTLLDELNLFGVYSVDDRGAIYSRKMVRDEDIRQKRAIAGQKGGICSSKRLSKSEANYQANLENENEDESDTDSGKPLWKTSFQEYQRLEQEAYDALRFDKKWVAEREKFHPNLNILRSLEKAHVDYWSAESGWKHKKKSRSKEIDWNATYKNALTFRMNQVWKPRGQEGQRKGPTDVPL